MGLGKNFGPQ